MEGNRRLEILPKAAAAEIGCDGALARLDSDASALAAENCGDVLRCSDKVTLSFRQVHCSTWTDEKHNLHLNHLEDSFVKQLRQSKGVFAHCSEQGQIDINTSQKRFMNVQNGIEQFTVLQNGCWQKIKYEKDEPRSKISADSRNSLKSPPTYHFKRTRSQYPQPSPNMSEFLKLSSIDKHGEVVVSHGLATFRHEVSSNSLHEGDDLIREGTGQNFLDNDNENISNVKSRAKRPRTASEDSSNLDQIVPSKKCPKDSTLGQ